MLGGIQGFSFVPYTLQFNKDGDVISNNLVTLGAFRHINRQNNNLLVLKKNNNLTRHPLSAYSERLYKHYYTK
jgi:hypothetical protein